MYADVAALDSFAGSRIETCHGAIAPHKASTPSAAASSATSQRALDWFTFFLADIQTGFGPFVAVYLSANAWTQGEIGLVLTAGGLVALAGQMPAGVLVDAARSARLVATVAIVAISISALALALWPIFPVVMGARVLHAGASCILGPIIAALSLAVAGHMGFGERLGRNARFASLGAGITAAAMGACGQFLSSRSVFLLTAALALPAIVMLARIRSSTPSKAASRPSEGVVIPGEQDKDSAAAGTASWRKVLTDRRLLIFAACVVLFHLANAGMLPLMGGILAAERHGLATSAIAACMIVPQVIVVVASPMVGRKAERWGRRPLLLVCFAALATRAALFALVSNPYSVIAVQLLDGVSAALLGVMFPLIIADITCNTGRFNLALGAVGSAMGIGAALSTTLAGFMFDRAGATITFSILAGIAFLGLGLAWLLMPETRPKIA
jgi:MFS family permease